MMSFIKFTNFFVKSIFAFCFGTPSICFKNENSSNHFSLTRSSCNVFSLIFFYCFWDTPHFSSAVGSRAPGCIERRHGYVTSRPGMVGRPGQKTVSGAGRFTRRLVSNFHVFFIFSRIFYCINEIFEEFTQKLYSGTSRKPFLIDNHKVFRNNGGFWRGE